MDEHVPCPYDGMGEPGRIIQFFGGAVMAFGGSGGPGLLPGDSGIGNALPQIPQILFLQHLIFHVH